MPGIDALRALAVLGVFLYHAGVRWVPGGFLGVDVFFVISGYLIASLLLSEQRRSGRVDFKRFWLRRARRLLPAVGVFIAVTMIAAAILVPGEMARLRGDAVSALAYIANWHFIFSHQSYFEQFQRPSLFRHLWSLSVEEQFYLVWPLLFAGGMAWLGQRRLTIGVIGGAVASIGLMGLLFSPDHDPTRIYFGTDTRAIGLLLGVALAMLWSPWSLRRARRRRWSPAFVDAVGTGALALLLLSFFVVHDFDRHLYEGGFLFVGLCTAVLIAALAYPTARIGRLLGQKPLLWLGLRSYSFYLWHWPVLALSRPGVDVSLPRGVLIPLQLALVLVLADLSYRFVELPFQGKAKLPTLFRGRLRFGRPALAAVVVATVLLVGWSGIVSGGERLQPGIAAASTARSAIVRASVPAAAGRGSATAKPSIVALGDSVMIGARDQLKARLGPRFSMNARIGRQAANFVAIVRHLRADGRLPDELIIQMGDNGPLYSDDMSALRAATAGVGRVFLVNDHAPVSWQDESNGQLAKAAREWSNATLIDWHATEKSRDGLTWDRIHLTPAGAKVYSQLVARAVKAPSRFRAFGSP